MPQTSFQYLESRNMLQFRPRKLNAKTEPWMEKNFAVVNLQLKSKLNKTE